MPAIGWVMPTAPGPCPMAGCATRMAKAFFGPPNVQNILLSCAKESLLPHPSMEPTPPTALTIGQAHGGLLKTFVEQHKLVENQVLTQEEAAKLLNHSCDAPKPLEIQDLLHRVDRHRNQLLRLGRLAHPA